MSTTVDDELVAAAMTATRTTRISVEAFEQIANLQNTCPLAAEIAVEALREIKAVLLPGGSMGRVGIPDRHQTRREQGVPLRDQFAAEPFDAALGEGRR